MIRKLSTLLANESVLLLGLTAAVLTALNVEKEWQDVAQAAIPLVLAMAVRSIASSPATLAAAVDKAATETAEQLTDATVGSVGNVTQKGQAVIDGVVDSVVQGVGGLVGAIAQPKEKAA